MVFPLYGILDAGEGGVPADLHDHGPDRQGIRIFVRGVFCFFDRDVQQCSVIHGIEGKVILDRGGEIVRRIRDAIKGPAKEQLPFLDGCSRLYRHAVIGDLLVRDAICPQEPDCMEDVPGIDVGNIAVATAVATAVVIAIAVTITHVVAGVVLDRGCIHCTSISMGISRGTSMTISNIIRDHDLICYLFVAFRELGYHFGRPGRCCRHLALLAHRNDRWVGTLETDAAPLDLVRGIAEIGHLPDRYGPDAGLSLLVGKTGLPIF